MNKILISPSSFGECSAEPLNILKKAGFEVTANPYKRRLRPEEIVSLARDCIGIIAGVEPLDKGTLLQLKNLQVISRVGTGLESIDLKAAEELGIVIKNTPDAPTQAVAELTVGLILNLLRNISLQDRLMHDDKWEKKMGSLLLGKTIGIIGIGRIGKRVAELLKGMNIKVIAYDLKPDVIWATRHNIELRPLNDLFKLSDVITVHISYNGVLIGEREFKTMKKGAYLINTSRGGVIEEKALCKALENDQIAGAALDVFSEEPYRGPLAKFNNVILTPHIGSYARESRISMEIEAVRNLLEGLNFPEETGRENRVGTKGNKT